MALEVKIQDGSGRQQLVKVTGRGQLVVGPIAYNTTESKSLTVVNTAYNFVEPIGGQRFVLDGIIFSTDKNVSQTDGAIITIYEATSATSATVAKSLFTLNLSRLTEDAITGLNVITTAGVWINAKTDDNNCSVTIIGYFVETVT